MTVKTLNRIVLGLCLMLLCYGCTTKTDTESNAETTSSVEATAKSKFEYEPPKPQNGERFGAIILGSSGFDAFVVEIDSAKNWELVEADYGVSNVYENQADASAIKTGLQDYVSAMVEKEVAGDKIHFIVSSSAKEDDRVKEITATLETLGYVVNPVDEAMEARCAYYSAIPPAFRGESFVVDIGSGNTKISWFQNDEVKSVATYGSKYYVDEVADSTVYNAVVKASMAVPEANIDKAFFIGGAAYQLAKVSRKNGERYTTLDDPMAYGSIEDQKGQSGVNIYKALQFSTKCETFIFDWHSNFAIGFLLLLD